MKFPYAEYQVVPSPAAPDRDVLYRPVIRVRFAGAKSAYKVWALVDTGADESYITQSLAEKLGIAPLSDESSTVESASGAMNVWYGRITIDVADTDEVHSFSTIIGVVSEEWSECILSHIGFLEHFDATFSHVDKTITLTRRTR
jgi:predicted aspartyl protease